MISSDNAKTLLIVGAVGAGLYVAWKLYAASGSIKDSVAKTVTDAAHALDLAATKVGAKVRASGGGVPGTGADQTDAESARLARQDAIASANLPAAPVPEAVDSGDYRPAVPEEYGVDDWMMRGFSSSYVARTVTDSPDALGSTAP